MLNLRHDSLDFARDKFRRALPKNSAFRTGSTAPARVFKVLLTIRAA